MLVNPELNSLEIEQEYAPNTTIPVYTEQQLRLLTNFVDDPYGQPYFISPLLPPEVIAAIASRTSRVEGDLREILATEYLEPFVSTLEGGEVTETALGKMINFLETISIEDLLTNPRARSFFIKWLAGFGDDSIAQMAGMHLVFPGLSQVAVKEFEKQRMGLAFLEQSSRYVKLGSKVNGMYRYYRSPDFYMYEQQVGDEYVAAMDNLFDTYNYLYHHILEYVKQKYPDENEGVLSTYVLDNIRRILPVATLTQVAAFGSGQAFEYFVERTADQDLGEFRWAGRSAYKTLNKLAPTFFTRVEGEKAADYRKYLSSRLTKVRSAIASSGRSFEPEAPVIGLEEQTYMDVDVFSFDPDGEDKVIAAMIFEVSVGNYTDILSKVKQMSPEQKLQFLQTTVGDRLERWYKMPRAFEMANVQYQVDLDIAAWRDIQRHRTKTQIKQVFTPYRGFVIPDLVKESGLEQVYTNAIKQAEHVWEKLNFHNPELAQYALTFAHTSSSIHQANLRAIFWETELRTIGEGDATYRQLEMMLARKMQEIYPLISQFLMVNWDSYTMARRGTPEKQRKKEDSLRKRLT